MSARKFTIEVDEDWLDVLEEMIDQSESNSDSLTTWVLEADIFHQFKVQLNEVGYENPVFA